MLRPLIAEVAPAGPALEAVPFLLAFAGLIVALGLIKFADALVRALFGTTAGAVGWIPFAGKLAARPIHKIEQKLTNMLGRAEQAVDGYIGYCWHNFARLMRWTFHEIERLAYQMLVASTALALAITPKMARKLIDVLIHPLRAFQAIERKLLHLEHIAIHKLQAVAGSIVLPRIRTLDHALDHVIEWDIPWLRARERALANRVDKAWKWIRSHEKIVVTAAFTGAVAVALGRLGLGWARCKNWRRIGRHVCGLPFGLIESLLGLALAFLVVVRPRDVAKAAIETEEIMHEIIVRIAEAAD